jgi:hypothetical protein
MQDYEPIWRLPANSRKGGKMAVAERISRCSLCGEQFTLMSPGQDKKTCPYCVVNEESRKKAGSAAEIARKICGLKGIKAHGRHPALSGPVLELEVKDTQVLGLILKQLEDNGYTVAALVHVTGDLYLLSLA